MTGKKEMVTFDTSKIPTIWQGLTKEDIETLKTECMDLQVKGVDDKDGYERVYKKQQIIKGHLSNCEKVRKGLKEKVTSVSKLVDNTANEFKALMFPIRDDLQTKRDVIEKEKERLSQEKAKKAQEDAMIKADALKAVNAVFVVNSLYTMSDEDYQHLLHDATKAFNEEKALQAKIEQDKKDEVARLEKQRREQERVAREQKESEAKIEANMKAVEEKQRKEQAKIDKQKADIEAEKKAIADAKAADEAEKQRQIDIDEAKKEAAIQATKDAEAKAKKEAEEKAAAEQKLKDELEIEDQRVKAVLEREERLAPDRDKMIKLAAAFSGITFPEVKSSEADRALDKVKELQDRLVTYIREQSKNL